MLLLWNIVKLYKIIFYISGVILWDLAIEKLNEKVNSSVSNEDSIEEKNILFLGSHDSVNGLFVF